MTILYSRDARVIPGIKGLRFFPLQVLEGHGSRLFDPPGRGLLDLSASWTAPAPPRTARRDGSHEQNSSQSPGITYPLGSPPRLCRSGPGSLGSSSWHRRTSGAPGNSGVDANDPATRNCRHYLGRRTVLAIEASCHCPKSGRRRDRTTFRMAAAPAGASGAGCHRCRRPAWSSPHRAASPIVTLFGLTLTDARAGIPCKNGSQPT